MTGKIVRIISNLYTVDVNGKKVDCQARGKFRKDNITPLVGDVVTIDESKAYILEILKRKNELKRPSVANVDVAVIVTSVKEPNISLSLLDKQISIVILNKIKPIICFSKLDLLNIKEKKEVKVLKKYYKKQKIKVLTNRNIYLLKRSLKNNTVVFTGQTGAGKSSLLNKIDKTLKLKTGEISKALGRGKHTTRHVELFENKNMYIVDTPGFSALDINEFSKEEIRDSFIEFKSYSCQFKNCMHLNELACAVKQAVNEGKILESR